MPGQTPRQQLTNLIDEHWAYRIQSVGKVGCYGCTSQWLDYDGHAEHLTELIEDQAGWRPPARVIKTPENEGDYTDAIATLDALPRGAVIQFRCHVYQSIGSGWWEAIGRHRAFSTEQVVDLADGDDVTVLHTPENGDTHA